MNRNILLLPLFLATVLAGCQKKQWTVTQQSSTVIALDSTTEALADRDYEACLQPLKAQMAAQMDIVIGQSAQAMRAGQPESLLSNFSADVFRKAASDYLQQPVDMSVVNIGGLRTDLPQGDITVGKMFELMPFENELVILWLGGDQVLALCDIIASVGGEGVSGLRMGIKEGKALNPTIGGQPIDPHKTYLVATNDYLAGGNDRLTPLAEYSRRENTGIKVRNMFIDYIKAETQKGNIITTQSDGRIYEAE